MRREEEDRKRSNGVFVRYLIEAWTFIMDVSGYRKASHFIWHSTENIIVHEGQVYRNVVLAAHASDKSALSFLPLLAGAVSLNPPCLFLAPALVARRYGTAPRAILISTPSID